ncbi:MAG TPA: kelch repeat-containing protein, partial [Vicinamibacterales bacterium]|nr:kelch repeat-containing protein [Vicinamibacterales bacterium]
MTYTRALKLIVIATLTMVALGPMLRANVPYVPPNTWAATGAMNMGRAGAAATLLRSGRVLITGGKTADGISAAAERYSPNGGVFLATSSMHHARANHTATLLPDGRVLVVGGVGAAGPLASAEVFDPQANAWTEVAPTHVVRNGHSATALSDGRVVIAGGEASGLGITSVEVFDPQTSVFTFVGELLSEPRTAHAAALLADDRVLIVGGYDGTSVLQSADIYDPATNSVTSAGMLTFARAAHTATTLLDGKVLIAGGGSNDGDLGSAEIFDPELNAFIPVENALTPRQRHQAILLPHNNQVLIVGGMAGTAAVSAAELFVPWEGNGGAFRMAPAPTAARAWTSAAALSFPADLYRRSGPNDGLVVLSGGSAASDASNGTNSAELYGFATVKTDQADYAPGTKVIVTGGGWVPGESVKLIFKEASAPFHGDRSIVVTADSAGNIISDAFAPEEHDLGVRFFLTAIGGESQARTTFTDSASQNAAIRVEKSSSTTVITGAGQVVPYTFSVTNEGNVTLNGVTVSDSKCDAAPVFISGDTNSDGMLQTTETWLYSCNHTVTASEANAAIGGALSNTVLVSSSTPASAASSTLDIPGPPSLTLLKQVINNNGGTSGAGAWTLTATGSSPSPTNLSGSVAVSSGPGFQPDTYTLAESGPTGYTASLYSCVKNGGPAAAGNSITLGNGDNATCTIINNDQPPSLTLFKSVINDNGGTRPVTDWTLKATGPSTIQGQGGVASVDTFIAGSYLLSETGPLGYSSSPYSCSLNGGPTVSSNAITLGIGDTAICTITNDDIAPTLTVVKTVVNDNGGTKQVPDFGLFVNGSPVTSGASNTLAANTLYTVSETSLAGYAASAWGGDCAADGTITLQPGDSKTCTITNNDVAPTLTIVKTVVNDNGGTKQVSDFALFVNGSPVTSGTPNTLTANTLYTISETNLAGYAASAWSGDCAPNGAITLQPGDTKTCTITNDDIAPKLTVVKTVVNDNGGAKTVADFPLFVNGSPVTSGTPNTLSANTLYTVSETTSAGYAASAWGGDCAADGTITLQPGDDRICTITNNDIAPTLTVVKTVVNDSGGTKQVSDFALFVNAAAVTSGVVNTLSANTLYTVTETNLAGYAPSPWGGDCAADGTITLQPGDSKTCTITNDDIAPTLTVVKTVVNDHGGTKQVSDFALFVNGSPVTSGAPNTLTANAPYTVTEANQPGYLATAWSGDCAADGTITLLPGDNKTCTITNDDVAPTLTVVKTVINDNGGTKQVSDFALFVNGSPVTSGSPNTLSANTLYTVSETNLAGYTASAWGGDCAVNGTITLLPGDSKTCTITNDDVAPTLTVVKTVVNDNGGTKQVSDFALFVNGSPVTSGTPNTLSANTLYTVTEINLAGYTASVWGGDCAVNGTITLLPGDSKTCTITNDDVAQ